MTTVASMSDDPPPPLEKATTQMSPRRDRWTLEATKLLLVFREEVILDAMKRDPHTAASMTSTMWNEVSDRLKKRNIFKTGVQCTQKFANLKTAYNGQKDDERKSGAPGPKEATRRLAVDVYDLMDAQFSKKASTGPPVTVQLSGGITENRAECLTPSHEFPEETIECGPEEGNVESPECTTNSNSEIQSESKLDKCAEHPSTVPKRKTPRKSRSVVAQGLSEASKMMLCVLDVLKKESEDRKELDKKRTEEVHERTMLMEKFFNILASHQSPQT